MKKITNLLSLYLPRTPFVFVYMLQQVEYDPIQFLAWVRRTPGYRKVIRRKKLVQSNKAKLLILVSYAVWLSSIVSVCLLVLASEIILALAIFLILPFVIISVLSLLTYLFHKLLDIARSGQIDVAREKMNQSTAKKIAVIGSFGKTTTKELLAEILSESYKVKFTPGNMNVLISHARWINNNINGDEDFIIFEYGEYRPGDIAAMASLTSPDYAVITGFAPNHLDSYKTIEALKEDLSSIKNYVDKDNIYSLDQAEAELKIGLDVKNIYSLNGSMGWKVTDIENKIDGLGIKLKSANKYIDIKSGLVGRHLVPSISFVSSFALSLGMSKDKLIEAMKKTQPFEHRLKPANINGAWVIDDTYNGNIEGIRAGLGLLKELSASRKVYVTPGLVEQGASTEAVHKLIAKLIIDAAPDQVVLMKNSATRIILKELKDKDYGGEVKLIDDPLLYYSNLSYQLASGDLVLMQNDWTDNYN